MVSGIPAGPVAHAPGSDVRADARKGKGSWRIRFSFRHRFRRRGRRVFRLRRQTGPAEAAGEGLQIGSAEQSRRGEPVADGGRSGVQRLVTGETDNVAEVMEAVNKAGIAFDLLMEIRNKLSDAYQEVQQMRV